MKLNASKSLEKSMKRLSKMKPGNQRIKGRAFEQKIARILKHIWPEAKRGWQFRGGRESCDIIGTPYHIECSKGGESIWAKWKQAKSDIKKSLKNGIKFKEPVVIKQRDRELPVVMIDLQAWLTLETIYQSQHLNRFIDLDPVYTQYNKEFGDKYGRPKEEYMEIT